MCTVEIPTEHQHVVDLESRSLLLRLPALLPAVRARRRGGRAVPCRAGPLPALVGFAHGAGRVGRLQIPVGVAFFFHNSVVGRDRRPSTRAPRRDRVAPPARRVGRLVASANPVARARWSPTSRRCSCASDRRGPAESLRRARSTPATSWSACSAATGRASTAARRPTRQLDGFFAAAGRTDARSPRRRADVSDCAFEVLDARAEPYAAAPTLMFRLRIEETSGDAVHALVLRAQIRIEPQRRRYSADEEDRLYELFGETPQWGETLRPFLWTHVATIVAGLQRDDRDRPPGRVHLRLRGSGGQVPARARRRRRSPSSSCSAGPRSPTAGGGLQRRSRCLEPRGDLPAARSASGGT